MIEELKKLTNTMSINGKNHVKLRVFFSENHVKLRGFIRSGMLNIPRSYVGTKKFK